MAVPIEPIRFEGAHCSMAIARPDEGTLTLTITGRDAGELGDEPFLELDRLLGTAASLVDFFIDARQTTGASLDVSGRWALWLRRNQARLGRVLMLTHSRYVTMTAGFVRRYSGIEDRMTVIADEAAFESALARVTR